MSEDTTVTVPKFHQLNVIDDVWGPKYSEDKVYIDINKIRRSKLDIKLRFSNVNNTSGYSGDWFLPRSKALKGRQRYNNRGRTCVVIPFSEFKRLVINERDIRALI